MLQTKNALVTGATSGIGYELARLLAKNGYGLVLVARNGDRLDAVSREITGEFAVPVFIIPADLSLPSAPGNIKQLLQEKSIEIDILVNNAGFNEYGPFTETDLQKELQMIQLNIASLTHLTKLLLSGMVARKSGRILNVGSTGSFGPAPLNAVYCAAKAYILSFSEAIAEELKGTGVTVTTLCPGATKTEFADRANMGDVKLFQGSLMSAKDVADTGYRALMKGKRTVIAGCANQLLVCSTRFAPKGLLLKIVKSMMSRK